MRLPYPPESAQLPDHVQQLQPAVNHTTAPPPPTMERAGGREQAWPAPANLAPRVDSGIPPAGQGSGLRPGRGPGAAPTPAGTAVALADAAPPKHRPDPFKPWWPAPPPRTC